MAALSILIPVEECDGSPKAVIESVAAKPQLDLEVLIVPATADLDRKLELSELAGLDPRVNVVPAANAASTTSLWNHAVAAAAGRWLTLIRPDDILEPEALSVADFAKNGLGTADSIGWNALHIAPDAEPGKASSVAIPTKFDVVEFNKTDILKSFFLWEGSINVPKVPFGLYHGILSRELAGTIAQTIAASGREHMLAQWEWTARAALMGEKFAFCSRPLSVINTKAYSPPAAPLAHEGFPFHAGVGLTAGIAEIQHAAFAEMGAEWTGTGENFVRACIYDCMHETQPQAFNDKCNAYYGALLQWEGGIHAPLFRPTFTGERPLDKRRGLHGNLIMIDRHIAGARNAQEFYKVIRNFLVPIGIICGAKPV